MNTNPNVDVDVSTNLPNLTYYNLFFRIVDYINNTYDYSKLSALLEKLPIPEDATPELIEMLKEIVKESYSTAITNQTLVLISIIDSLLKSYGRETEINFEELIKENLTVREAILVLRRLLEKFFKLSKDLGMLPTEYEELLPEENMRMFSETFK